MITFRIGRPGINLFNPNRVLFFLWLFLLVFPKGGFKIGGIPITWGYLLLGIVGIFVLLRRKWIIQNNRLITILSIFPFQLISIFSMLSNGFESTEHVISFLINYFILPYLLVFLLSDDIENLDMKLFFRLFKNGVFFVALYGIFLFFFKNITGKFLEIPFLTVNLGDLGSLELKHIHRGNAFKLISTYNNGNIFGVCLLILLPLYCYLEDRISRHVIVKGALILTFSRTVWATLFFYEICSNMFFSKTISRGLVKIVLKLVVLSACMMPMLYYYDFFTLSFLFDSSLGGRASALNFSDNFHLFPSKSFNGIHEMVYYWIFYDFGIVGFVAYGLGILSPIFLYFRRRSLQLVHQYIGLGLINHLFACLSDGTVFTLPTMAFYWFLLSLFARNSFPDVSDRKYNRLFAWKNVLKHQT